MKTLRTAATSAALLLAACSAQPVVEYDTSYDSAIEFGRNLGVAMQKGADKQLHKLFNNEHLDGENRVFTTQFFPTSGSEGVMRSFQNYCTGVGGTFRDGLCSTDSELTGYFFVSTAPTGTSVGGVKELTMEVIEPQIPPSTDLVTLAQRRGYVTQFEDLAKKQISQQREIANHNALAAQKAAQLEKTTREEKLRRQRSIETRALVLQKGTLVCPVDPNDYTCNHYKCYTEDANASTGRIKISALKTMRWDDASMWFACQ